MIDPFYTPTPLAVKLASYVDAVDVSNIADFCIGDGELVRAAISKYPEARCYGVDICEDVILELKRKHPDWILSNCDFEDDDSIKNILFLRNQSFDLIMLNPPFTCKGSVVETIYFKGHAFKVSTAMKFVMRALEYLSDNGGLYAILPISCVYSDKDKKAWNYLCKNYYACILDEPERVYFSKRCSPSIALVYVGKKELHTVREDANSCFQNLPVIDIVRGSVRMQGLVVSKSKKAQRLIHTTNMQEGKLVGVKRILTVHNAISGYGVVVPRVCNPNKSKIVLMDDQKQYVLSDCVVFLKTLTLGDAMNVSSTILANWHDFENLYKGTGARYTTVERLKKAFGVSNNNASE